MKLAIVAIFIGFVFGAEYSIPDLIKCSSSGKTSTVNDCRLDGSNRTIILSFTLLKKIEQTNVMPIRLDCPFLMAMFFQMTMSLQKSIEGKFKRFFTVSDFDWCKFMSKDFRKTSPTVKIILDAIKDSTSGSLLHPCPYIGEHKANITIKKSVIILSPAGLYKISLLAHNFDDPEILLFVAVVEIKAS